MKPEAMRIAIAEACGRKPEAYYCAGCRECVAIEEVTSGGYHDKCGSVCRADLPSYDTDLNVMASAEATLTDEQREKYGEALYWMPEIGMHDMSGDGQMITYQMGCNFATATSIQRAEAFLRTLGKWVEEKEGE